MLRNYYSVLIIMATVCYSISGFFVYLIANIRHEEYSLETARFNTTKTFINNFDGDIDHKDLENIVEKNTDIGEHVCIKERTRCQNVFKAREDPNCRYMPKEMSSFLRIEERYNSEQFDFCIAYLNNFPNFTSLCFAINGGVDPGFLAYPSFKLRTEFFQSVIHTLKNITLISERVFNENYDFQWYNTKLDLIQDFIANSTKLIGIVNSKITSDDEKLLSNIRYALFNYTCKKHDKDRLTKFLMGIKFTIEKSLDFIYSEPSLWSFDKFGSKSLYKINEASFKNKKKIEYSTQYNHFITNHSDEFNNIMCETGKHNIYFSNFFISLVFGQNKNQNIKVSLSKNNSDEYLLIKKFRDALEKYDEPRNWSSIVVKYNDPKTKLNAIETLIIKCLGEFFDLKLIKEVYLNETIKSLTQKMGNKIIIMLVTGNENDKPELRVFIEFRVYGEDMQIKTLWKPLIQNLDQ